MRQDLFNRIKELREKTRTISIGNHLYKPSDYRDILELKDLARKILTQYPELITDISVRFELEADAF